MKKTIILLILTVCLLGMISCRKEKCQYYWDIRNYYDKSEETWIHSYEHGDIDSVDLHNQLYKINREREALQKQYKDCIDD